MRADKEIHPVYGVFCHIVKLTNTNKADHHTDPMCVAIYTLSSSTHCVCLNLENIWKLGIPTLSSRRRTKSDALTA